MATSTPSTPAFTDVRTSLGPILISSVLAWILWGMLTMQVIRYYLSYAHYRSLSRCHLSHWFRYQRDSSVMKGMVCRVSLPSDVTGLTNALATRSPPFGIFV